MVVPKFHLNREIHKEPAKYKERRQSPGRVSVISWVTANNMPLFITLTNKSELTFSNSKVFFNHAAHGS